MRGVDLGLKTRLLTLGLTFAVVVGALAGILFPNHAIAAIIWVDLYVNPGPETNTLTCGWHTACVSPYSSGPALDWNNPVDWSVSGGRDRDVRWVSYGFRSDTTGDIGDGLIADASATCKAIDVQATDAFGFSKGYIRYTHSYSWVPGWYIAIYGSPGGAPSSSAVANTARTELSACVSQGFWSAPHLHQLHSSEFGARPTNTVSGQTVYPTGSAMHTSLTYTGSVGGSAYWAADQHWCWFCP
jgi:hypothetical protein